MTVLYINNEYCSSVEHLKGYFFEDLTPESDVYADLLDYGRHGEIGAWLREKGELELSSRVDSIDSGLSDSAFYAQLKAIITGVIVPDLHNLKPAFDKCFSVEDLKCDVKDTEAEVRVVLKVLLCVNEEYELSVTSNWGTRTMMINPYFLQEGKTMNIDFTLCKLPGKEIGEICVRTKDIELKCISNSNSKQSICIDGIGDCFLTMVHIPGTGALPGFYVSETPITIQQYKALYPKDVSFVPGSVLHKWFNFLEESGTREYEEFTLVAPSFVDVVLDFVNKLSQPIIYHLPTREQWLYLAENYYERVKWCNDSKFLGLEYEAIAWEMMQDNSCDIYCLLGVVYENGKRIIKGNNFPRGQERDNIAFRLVCSESEIKSFFKNSSHENR